ncbi:photosystem I reaction center subunit VI, chloroplastic [Tanacetum coccineum]
MRVKRAEAVVAKYGDKSVYFDLEDLGNITGEWDVYGLDAPSPYNSLQGNGDPCLTERDAHHLLYVVELMLVTTGLSGGGTFMSGRGRDLLSPSGRSFVDETIVRKMLSTFINPMDPLWLAVFPEGTDFT